MKGIQYLSQSIFYFMLNRKSSSVLVIVLFATAFVFAVFFPATALMKGSSSSEKKIVNVSSGSGDQFNSENGPVKSTSTPDIVQMIGPVSQDRDLRDLPNIPPTKRDEVEPRLRRHPLKRGKDPVKSDPYPVVNELLAPSAMPAVLSSFAGITSAQSACGCLPPDTNGDVGSHHYIQSVNSRIKIIDKVGTQLLAPTTYNSFFSALGPSTPCGNNQNDGDGIVFYDHIADRWIVSDFAFPGFPGTSFYQCIGVAKTSDPVSGGWWLYAVQTDPSNPNYLGDYPKFGLWPDGYYMSVNMFSNNTTFNGARVYAFNRNAMINGGAASTIAFTVAPADLGDQYSLMPATFRTGSAPPAGQAEYFMSINSSTTAGTVETQVFVRRFHADFVTPANSTFGVGATHAPDGIVAVNPFVDAYTATASNIVPNGTVTTSQFLDTLGDKLMSPLVYQNLGGTESIYASHTINNNQNGTGPTAIRWYQFNVTGNTIPSAPAQQQTFNNGADGLWRAMPSINVDAQGNLAIGYTASSTTVDPGIRYAGRLATDPPNDLAQGEATLIAGGGHQTSTSGRWGDYSSMFVDPADNCTFWHTNEYFSATSGSAWNTRIGSFKYSGCTAGATPTATSTPTNTPTNTATPTATPTAPPAITGTVTYGNSIGAPASRFVSNVLISGAGSPNVSTLTGGLGTYSLSGFGSGSYTITPSKSGGSNGSITSFDAAKIAQYVSGNILLSPAQQIVADASGAGGISSFDAALLAHYAISTQPSGMAGNWVFSPVNNTHATVSNNITGEDYTALLIGDVSGNWADTGARPDKANGPELPATINAPRLTAPANADVIVPVGIEGAKGKGIISYQFDLRYDPSVIKPSTDPVDVAGTVSRALTAVANSDEPGLLRVVIYGPMPIEGNGALLNLRFTAVGKPGEVSPLTWEHIIFNEGDPQVTQMDGQIEITAAAESQ